MPFARIHGIVIICFINALVPADASTKRETGRSAQLGNIAAAKVFVITPCEALRLTQWRI